MEIRPNKTRTSSTLPPSDGTRDRIRLAAERNNRSMNSEIVNALERAFPGASGGKEVPSDAAEALEALRRVLERHGLL